MLSAFICGSSGARLTAEEARLFSRARPCGFILFARNCLEADQIRALIGDVRDAVGREDVLILIDQEGGRVRRLRPPLARELPAAEVYGALYRKSPEAALTAAREVARLLAEDLTAFGINANCAPVLDVPVEGAHDIIGDRAYGRDVDTVVACGRAVAEGLLAGGVLPIIKHIPGHGRAMADSHLELPRVATSRHELSLTDFAPFRRLCDLPAAMTAHVVYEAIDAARPASTSTVVVEDVIRGEIGFRGFLMSDDLSMAALSGSMGERALGVLRAGCDVALHCNGVLSEMEAVAEAAPLLAGSALARFEACLAALRRREPFDLASAERQLAGALTLASA